MNFFEEHDEQNNKKTKELLLHENFKNNNIKLMFISNADKTTSSVLLIKLKTLFQKQLSKMPREYILRQIFDSKHINLIILNNKDNIVGGICYRPFYDRKFFEIVFCAVDQFYQVKGVGSFMMDILKEHTKNEIYKYTTDYKFTNQIIHDLNFYKKSYDKFIGNIFFITYADNSAVGYFKKQGFSQNLSFDSWIGYIKDYEGGTLMECNILWDINYLNKYEIIKNKRHEFIEELKKSTSFFKTYKIERPLFDIRSIPGVTADMRISTDKRNKENCLDGFIQLLINVLKNDPNSWPFLEPVNAKDVPEYYEIIKSPMDLSRIKDKFHKKLYTNLDVFISDVHLMLNNCFKFNARDTQYYKCAQALFEKFEERLKFYDESVKLWNLKN
ncbi:hypothetical protein NCER_100616 [Vairimorpha ceranae BRL01]|uniref:histone acetyltransferase n=2 Tax=Vairimorpha ceranae TaxID=40302 RepID=C4V816_VAIC1|nr:transcriptional activator [Vairimorpha ceranae]EEQ82638.1 hypothetical protein NCER_100616 [Vairimorpha ceranae BRL01]KAF5141252.1 hypothetical protein G9O61_00g005690 [Vairimorpha ceranae]KKO76107.1 transcriptional activator [Vairimorpha ceranae]